MSCCASVCCSDVCVYLQTERGGAIHFLTLKNRLHDLYLRVLTLLSLCSDLVQASMKVWEMTCSDASTTSVTWTSKMKWGFLRMFTQNLEGKLRRQKTPNLYSVTFLRCQFQTFPDFLKTRWHRFLPSILSSPPAVSTSADHNPPQ